MWGHKLRCNFWTFLFCLFVQQGDVLCGVNTQQRNAFLRATHTGGIWRSTHTHCSLCKSAHWHTCSPYRHIPGTAPRILLLLPDSVTWHSRYVLYLRIVFVSIPQNCCIHRMIIRIHSMCIIRTIDWSS